MSLSYKRDAIKAAMNEFIQLNELTSEDFENGMINQDKKKDFQEILLKYNDEERLASETAVSKDEVYEYVDYVELWNKMEREGPSQTLSTSSDSSLSSFENTGVCDLDSNRENPSAVVARSEPLYNLDDPVCVALSSQIENLTDDSDRVFLDNLTTLTNPPTFWSELQSVAGTLYSEYKYLIVFLSAAWLLHGGSAHYSLNRPE